MNVPSAPSSPVMPMPSKYWPFPNPPVPEPKPLNISTQSFYAQERAATVASIKKQSRIPPYFEGKS